MTVEMSESRRSSGKVLKPVNCYRYKGCLLISEDTQEFLCPWETELWVLEGNYFDQ